MPERFVYHASAAGVGARITRIDPPKKPPTAPQIDNVDYIVPVQGASCLPVFGGLSESTSGPYAFRVEYPRPLTLMSVGSVWTRASSVHPSKRPYRAEVEARASSLQFIERIMVQHAVARLVTTHRGGVSDPPEVTPEGSELEGLLLDGIPIQVEVDPGPFCRFPTFQHVLDNIKDKALAPHFPADLVGLIKALIDRKKDQAKRNEPEIVVGSIVRDIKLPDKVPDGVSKGPLPNQIHWEGVGNIFLGELLMSRTERRLTMVRLELGSDVGGRGGGPEVQGNSGPVQGN